jgi:4-aminobutyrate aminotransferase-like enzyme
VTAAITAQAATMAHCPSAVGSRVRAGLAERLVALAPAGLTRVLPAVTGAMANEFAVALARAATGRRGVIAFAGGYFGRSLGSVGLAGKHGYRAPLGVEAAAQFLPFPDRYRSPWAGGRDPGAAVLALLDELLHDPGSGVAAPACILIEPIQGNGGVVIPPPGFLAGLRAAADSCGALLVFDEIQCGFGRAGRTWACEHDGVVPDLLTAGKGIGGGLPFAAVLGREDVMTAWAPDAITSTFLTNAVHLAAATAAIDVFRDEHLAERSAHLGAHALDRLRAGLAGAPTVGDVRGRGLFCGVELVRDRSGQEPAAGDCAGAVKALRDRGVIVGRGGRHGNVLKLSPALTIAEADLDAGLDAILEVLP